MRPLTRIDTAPNLDIQTGPDDEIAKRGHMAARAADAAMKAIMRTDAEKPKEEEKKVEERKDETGDTLDRILKCLDGLNSRMDAYEKARADGAEAAQMTDKKKDGDGKEMEEKGEPRELAADKRHDAYADAEIRNELAEIQSDADRASGAWSTSAPHPWDHEDPDSYRRRVAHAHKRHSALWKDVNLRELSGQALKNATTQIFKDSWDMACSDQPWEGGLREVRRKTDSGHLIKEYYGSPMAWMSQFTGGRRLARFNLSKIRNDR